MRPSLRQGTMSHWGWGALSTHSSHLPPAASHVCHCCVSHCPSVLLRVPALTGQVTGTRHNSRSPAGPGQSEPAQALSALWSGSPWPELLPQGSETRELGPGRKVQATWTAAPAHRILLQLPCGHRHKAELSLFNGVVQRARRKSFPLGRGETTVHWEGMGDMTERLRRVTLNARPVRRPLRETPR